MLQRLKENYFIRSLLYKLLNGLEVNRKIKGTPIKLYFNAGTNFNFFFSRKLEIERQVKNNLTAIIKEDFLVFDIGAHIGFYTAIFSYLCPKGRIIAFEPDTNNLKFLEKNMDLNKLKNVTIINKAVSRSSSELPFYSDISTGRTSALQPDAWHPNAARIQKLAVQTTTINEASKTYGIPNLIKCDV